VITCLKQLDPAIKTSKIQLRLDNPCSGVHILNINLNITSIYITFVFLLQV